MNGVQNLQILPLNSQHTPFGGILLSVTWDIVKIYLCTKFDVSSYTRSKFMKGGPKFTTWPLDPHHTPFGVICHPCDRDGTCQGLSAYQI